MEIRPLRELVARAKRGDLDALSEIISRFDPLIKSCSRGLRQCDREDLEQELRIQLFIIVTRKYDIA